MTLGSSSATVVTALGFKKLLTLIPREGSSSMLIS